MFNKSDDTKKRIGEEGPSSLKKNKENKETGKTQVL